MKKVIGYRLFIMMLLALIGSSCAQASSPTPAPAPGVAVDQVTIKDFAFNPEKIIIKVGDTVTWTHQDSTPHTTTGGIWDSGTLQQGQTYSRAFDKAGNFNYQCNIHPYMKGKVIVE